jgi:hypothetical protein
VQAGALLMDKNKRLLWYVVGAVVILVVLAVVLRGDKEGWSGTPTPTPTASPSVSVAPGGTPRTSVKPPVTPASYGDAVRLYADRRIQFDMYCQANPLNNTYKNGTNIMLDNRSGDARIITVNGVQYPVAGYGWKIITLSSKTLPATWAVDCGSARNVSKILIQQ